MSDMSDMSECDRWNHLMAIEYTLQEKCNTLVSTIRTHVYEYSMTSWKAAHVDQVCGCDYGDLCSNVDSYLCKQIPDNLEERPILRGLVDKMRKLKENNISMCEQLTNLRAELADVSAELRSMYRADHYELHLAQHAQWADNVIERGTGELVE